jgi:hypothetical protein
MPVVRSKVVKTPSESDAVYSGEVDENGQPHGFGERTIASKDQFEGQINTGEWVRSSFQGVGKIVTQDGQCWTGEFASSVLEGVGLWVDDSSGNRYAGQWKDGMKHGFGKYTWSDGRVYIGWWVADNTNGIALFVAANGSKHAGTFENGKLVAQASGVIVAADAKHILMLFRFPGGASTCERHEWWVSMPLFGVRLSNTSPSV